MSPQRAIPIGARIAARFDDGLYRLVRLVTRPSRTLRRRLEHSPLTGRLVELRGNVVSVEGLRFSVDSAAIAPAAKAPFVYGSYESAERRLLRDHLDPSLPVVELGGSIGVVSCLTNRRLHDPAAHVVVEANPALLPLLHANRERNGCEFSVVHAALSYGASRVSFGAASNFTAGSASSHPAATGEAEPPDAVTVPAMTLRQILDDATVSRCTLVCDVEGAEWAMVAQDAEVLRERVAALVIELHPEPGGGRPIEALVEQISALGFVELERRRETFVFQGPSELRQR